MKCFYHNDMDGRCAGFWVYNYATQLPTKEDIEMLSIDYKDRFSIETIQPYELIFIVDFSVEPDMMIEILKKTNRIVWIDHHKTAIDKYNSFEFIIPGVRQDGVAACILTYWFLNNNSLSTLVIQPVTPNKLKSVPMFTKLIGDRDIWAWKYGDRTKYFHAGLQLYDTHPQSPVWLKAMKDTTPFEEKGKIVEQYKKMYNKELVDAFAFETEFEGYSAIACNVGRTSSELFDSVSKHYDLMITFVYDGKQYTVSLYSATVDVSEIAKKYGGGGHKGAAGFQCKELPFITRGIE